MRAGQSVHLPKLLCRTGTVNTIVHANSANLCLAHFSQQCTACILSEHLNSQPNFEVVAGYGIGSHPDQAMNNALAAAKEAAFRGHSYIKDEVGNLVGPLGSPQKMVISTTPQPNVGTIARNCGLSAMTIQKLITSIQSAVPTKPPPMS